MILKRTLLWVLALNGALALEGPILGASLKPVVSQVQVNHRYVWKKSIGALSGQIFILPQRHSFLIDEEELQASHFNTSHFKGKLLKPHAITMHGVAWDYDLQIPLVFFDPQQQWIRHGQFKKNVSQQNIAPTLARILNIPPPLIVAEPLTDILKVRSVNKPPKAIIIFVQDQMGQMYLRAHPGAAPYYETLLREGANFPAASVAHVDVETSVGHAAVGTGGWPGQHGISGNEMFHTGFLRQLKSFVFPVSSNKDESIAGHPGFLFSPTLADIILKSSSGQSKVFVQVSVARAALSLGGHGALFSGNKKVRPHVVWIDDSQSEEPYYTTNESLYSLPHAHQTLRLRPEVEALVGKRDGKWFDHSLYNTDGSLDFGHVRASPALTRWEGSLAVATIKELEIGADEHPDLVYINMKATDYCGHSYGFESDECENILKVTDQAAKEMVETIDRQTGGNYIAVLTADHGAAPLPELSGGVRYARQDLINKLNEKFDHNNNHVDAINAVTSSQIFINEAELNMNGFALQDVKKYLQRFTVKLDVKGNAEAHRWCQQRKSPCEIKLFQDVALSSDLK
jgi:hypothetical protein